MDLKDNAMLHHSLLHNYIILHHSLHPIVPEKISICPTDLVLHKSSQKNTYKEKSKLVGA